MAASKAANRIVLAVLAAVVLSAGGMAADEITWARAAEKFRSAFQRGIELKKRREILQKVAEEYKETAWADDALWCLTRLDLRRQNYEKVLERGEKLFKNNNMPSLEEFTRRTFIYQNSRMPAVVWVLERHGYRYRRTGKGHRVKVFNAVPMALRADMGRAAEKLDKLQKALRCYREAMSLSPGGSLFHRSYQQQVQRLQKKLKYRGQQVAPGNEKEKEEEEEISSSSDSEAQEKKDKGEEEKLAGE